MTRNPGATAAVARYIIALSIILFLACLAKTVQAEPHQFKISSGAAAERLREFGRQAGIQTLFDYRLVGTLQTRAVNGEYEPDVALTQMLEGTGLTFERIDAHTVAIRDPATSKSISDLGNAGELDEIVVASRLPSSTEEGAVPTEVYSHEQITRSGVSTVADFLNTLTSVSVQTTTTGQDQHANGATTVQLRGLPTGTTLVLLNGRRVQGSGSVSSEGFFDLNSIPVSAIERIEVLPTGSSAVYGGDALGGIVNIVFKQGFEGTEFDARDAGTTDGAYHDHEFSLASGWKDDRWSITVVGNYSKFDELRGSSRELTANQDYRPYGGVDARVPFANPGNVCTASGANLTGLDSPCAGVPLGSTGFGLTPASFAATAGVLNVASLTQYFSIIAPSEREGLYLTGNFDITPTVTAFAELLYNHLSLDLYVYPVVAIAPVAAGNPNNPFGQDLDYNGFLSNNRTCGQCENSNYYRPLIGLRGTLAERWHWEAAAWTSRDYTSIPTAFIGVDQNVLNADIANGTINPFKDGPTGSPAVLATLNPSSSRVYRGSLDSANAFIRGPVLSWWGGDVEALVGGEYEHDGLSSAEAASGVGGNYDFHRDTKAAFAELKVPIIGAAPASAHSPDRLSADFAYRYDDYSDFGGRSSLGAGLEYRPTASFMLRASYGSSLKPPTLYQLHVPAETQSDLITDPARGGATEAITSSYGGNSSLKAETGWSTNLGFVFKTATVPGLDFSMTHWTVRLNEGFVIPDINALLANPQLFPGRVTRAPAAPGDPYGIGPVTFIDDSYENFGHIKEAGVDLNLVWRAQTPWGEFSPAVAITEVYRYEFLYSPGSAPQNGVSQANDDESYAPRWKAVVSLGWKNPIAQMGITGRYTGPYRDVTDIRPVPLELGNLWYLDLNGRVELGQKLAPQSKFWSRLFLAAGVRNALNRLPVYSDNGYGENGYDPSQYDMVGRLFWGQVGLVF